ncbi:MAG: DUF3786 domain-containing protein [Anaerolineales bacterium]
MKNPKDYLRDQANQLEQRASTLRQELRQRPLENFAQLTATNFNHDLQCFEFHYWTNLTYLKVPEFIAFNSINQQPLNVFHQALILYYFHLADGAALAHRWIAFSELPEGRFYNQAFQGYTSNPLLQHFGENIIQLENAALSLHGEKIKFADFAFRFQVLPRLILLLAYWQGDEDFPPNYQILYDANVIHYLPTDVCAIAGKLLTNKLINPK